MIFLNFLVNSDPDEVFALLSQAVATGLDRAATGRGWLLWGGMTAIGLLALSVWRFRSRLVIPAIGAAGPSVVVGVYLVCCLWLINSPVIPGDQGKDFVDALLRLQGRAVEPVDLPRIATAVARMLPHKRMNGANYQLDSLSVEDVHQTLDGITVDRRPDAESTWWPDRLTTYRQPTLTIRVQNPVCLSEDPTDCVVAIDELSLSGLHTEWWFYLGGSLLFLFNYLFVSVNRISLHGFYRDRLSRTFLIAPSASGPTSVDPIKLSELGGPESAAPYHLVNTALNLQGSAAPRSCATARPCRSCSRSGTAAATIPATARPSGWRSWTRTWTSARPWRSRPLRPLPTWGPSRPAPYRSSWRCSTCG